MSKRLRLQPDAAAWPRVRDSVDRILADWDSERPDLDFSPVAVVTRLQRVRAYLDAGLARVFSAHDLSGADFQVIVTLRRSGEPYRLAQATLMTELALTSGTVSVRVDRLERAGIVVRSPDPDDRRGTRVTLTDRGLALFDRVAPEHLANEDRLLSALQPAERAQLSALLSRLLVSFESPHSAVGSPLGLRLEPAHVARERRVAVGLSDTPGLLVADLVAGFAAAAAGLARGDLLVAAAGMALSSESQLADVLATVAAGSLLQLTVLRGNDRLALAVQVPARPPGTARPRQRRTPTQPTK